MFYIVPELLFLWKYHFFRVAKAVWTAGPDTPALSAIKNIKLILYHYKSPSICGTRAISITGRYKNESKKSWVD